MCGLDLLFNIFYFIVIFLHINKSFVLIAHKLECMGLHTCMCDLHIPVVACAINTLKKCDYCGKIGTQVFV